MTQNKRVIGITGGSGCGKSHIAKRLSDMGCYVIDCDEIAREVTKRGEPCLLEIKEFFGEDILKDGELNRKKLAGIVFADSKKLQKLDEITHKFIKERIYNRINEAKCDTVIVDGAVLLESGLVCDKMVGILADKQVRKARIMLRDGLSELEADRRISAQQEDEFYLKNCDIALYNNDEDISGIIKRILE